MSHMFSWIHSCSWGTIRFNLSIFKWPAKDLLEIPEPSLHGGTGGQGWHSAGRLQSYRDWIPLHRELGKITKWGPSSVFLLAPKESSQDEVSQEDIASDFGRRQRRRNSSCLCPYPALSLRSLFLSNCIILSTSTPRRSKTKDPEILIKSMQITPLHKNKGWAEK